MSKRLRSFRGCCNCLRSQSHGIHPLRWGLPFRAFSSTSQNYEDVQEVHVAPPAQPSLDPNLVSTPREERKLVRQGILPIGSRRRRAALQTSLNIPFELLPYQCFQEARKILQADREEKIKQIEAERAKIQRLEAQPEEAVGGAVKKQTRLISMRQYLEKLKVQADLNDPLVKKRFEDGQGDMSRPIYRYLAEQKWRSRRRLINVQRITQMHVVPDILPTIDIRADVSLAFGRQNVQPGEFVVSRISSIPPKLQVQVFDPGERLVTIAVVDADVPSLEKDGFDYRCHFLASNVPLSPTAPKIHLQKLAADSQVALPWLPPYSQKGAPYHRLAVFVLQQPEGEPIDVADAAKLKRDGFILRSFAGRHRLRPVGCFLFRARWDEGTDGIMKKLGVEGWDMQLKRRRVEPLPPRKKDASRYR